MIKTISKKDILYTSIFHFTYFDRVNGNTYRVIQADIHMQGGYLLRAYSPFGYGYGDASGEMVNDLSKHNKDITCRRIRETLKTESVVEVECTRKKCKEIDAILKKDGVSLKDIKIID